MNYLFSGVAPHDINDGIPYIPFNLLSIPISF